MGALTASTRVELTLWQAWQLYTEQPSGQQVQFWLMLRKASTGQASEVPNSRTTFSVDGGRPGVDYFTTNKVTVALEPGDCVYARSTADVADGAYAQTNEQSKPLCITY